VVMTKTHPYRLIYPFSREPFASDTSLAPAGPA
jgi:hypothetical protein